MILYLPGPGRPGLGRTIDLLRICDMILKSKLFELEAVPLRGSKPALKVKCLAPGCTHRCTLIFETPRGFSSASDVRLDAVFSSLCAELAKGGALVADTVTQISLL